MLKRNLAIACLCASVFAGCINDKILDEELFNTVRLNTTIEPSNGSHERANIDIFGKGYFTDNDKITLLFNNNLRDLVWNGSKWGPDLSWTEIGEQATFTGFYPNITTSYGEFTHTVEVDQSKGKNFENSDILFADPITVNKGQEVDLKFKHLMSCLTVVLKGNRYTTEELQKAIIHVKAYNTIQMNADGTLGKVHDPNNKQHLEDLMAEIILKHKEGTTFQAILAPQDDIHQWSYGQGWWLRIKIGTKEYLVANPPTKLKDGSSFNNYESGKNITLNYSFNTVDEEFKNKTCWIEGLKGIPAIENSAWKTEVTGKLTQKYLPWKKEYGWYDCDKKNPAGPTYGDQNMCWAATSSNMIHWWFDRNKNNIEKYCQLNKKDIKSIPHVYTDHHTSEVFQLFKDKFEDKGGFPKNGLNWFFGGTYVKQGDAAELIDKKSGGYFEDVFGNPAYMVEHRGITNLNDLTHALKSAFRNKQAIGFAVQMPGFGSAHAMTIWGAKFDEKGDACAIYYVDNNDAPIDEKNKDSRLIQTRVGEFKGKACMENSQGEIAIQISDIDLLDLKEDEWKAYFSKHNANQ